MSPIPTPANLRRTAEVILRQCTPLLTRQDHISHLAYRTASEDELLRVLENARCLGHVKIDHQRERTYHWVMLHRPIEHEGQQLRALEFPAPRQAEDRPSGYYACVYHQPAKQTPPMPMDREAYPGMTLRLISVSPAILAPLRRAA